MGSGCSTTRPILEVEKIAFPNDGKPPEEVLRWLTMNASDLGSYANDEIEKKIALEWLKNIKNAHLSPEIKTALKDLLAVTNFTENMGYMKTFAPLQKFCQEELLLIGGPLQQLYRDRNDIQEISQINPPVHSKLTNDTHLRQDHPAVGIVCPSSFDTSTFNGESKYIHLLRAIASLVNERFQSKIEVIVTPLGGKHKGCPWKGDSRMRNKAVAEDDHRNEPKPRPASNIDIVRCCVTFDNVASFTKGIDAINLGFQNGESGIGRIKNGFALTEEEAAKSFHYRSFMMNLIVDFDIKYGELVKEPASIAMLEKYLQAPPENPDENWGRWKNHVTEAINYLKSDAMSNQKVIMICEVQVLLDQYLKARKQMHLLYKVVRADSAAHLAKQFAVAAVDGRPENATWVTEEKRYVEKTCGRVKKGEKLALFYACKDGFVAAVRVALEVDGVNVNQKHPTGQTPLWIASTNGHVEVTKLILTVDGVDVNQGEENGTTPLYQAAEKGHVDIAKLLIKAGAIVNQAEKDGISPLWIASFNGHVDLIKVIIEADGDVNQAKTTTGSTPLFIASSKGHTDIVAILSGAPGIQINQANNNGSTPLITASQEGHTDIVAILLGTPGIQINQHNNKNTTPLCMASYNGHTEVVRLLLQQPNIDLNKKDKWNDSPISSATKKHHTEIIQLLKNAGAQ